jgi:hypothetical protein
MKPIPYRDVKRKLEAAGFSIATQKGSHVKFLKQLLKESEPLLSPAIKKSALGLSAASYVKQVYP